MEKKTLVAVFLVLVVASGGWMGTRVKTEWSRLREIEAGIRAQAGALETAREEGRKLREQIERAKTDVAGADSLGANRVGVAMDRSFDIAKAEAIVEQDRLRAQRRLRHLNGERERAVGDLRRWSVIFAGVEAFLIGGLILVSRYRQRRG